MTTHYFYLHYLRPSFLITLKYVWAIVYYWWWLFVFFLLKKPFLYLWLWWRNERWLKNKYKPILLEIKIPRDIQKPVRAMENVMAGIHGAVYHPPDWWEKWIDGQLQTSASFEIVSLGGEIHFFIRAHNAYREAIESSIYSQYPAVEIKEVSDYTKEIPQDIPNKDWDLFSYDYRLIKEDPFPIRTYKAFETESEAREEKKVDPMSGLLEGLAQAKPGEQMWIQIRAKPLGQAKQDKFVEQGKELRDKLANREKKVKPSRLSSLLDPFVAVISDVITLFSSGTSSGTAKIEQKASFPTMMMLTPGEREQISEVERKISKLIFSCGIRVLFLGKRDIWSKGKVRCVFSYFNSFATSNLNALYPWGETLTKIHKSRFLPLNALIPRRYYLRRRKMFRNYKSRVNSFFPLSKGDKSIFTLNIEELASIYHFPSWQVAPVPGVLRVEAKKNPPPQTFLS